MSEAARTWLPNLIREMAERFGLPRALRFAQEFGGQYLVMPLEARADHPVAARIGIDVLEWLVAAHDKHERVLIPKASFALLITHRRSEVRRLSTLGFSATQIAEHLNLHVRQIYRIRAELDAVHSQHQLTLPL
jgi:hypothetical protein